MSRIANAWKKLNKRHNKILKHLEATYGGPDISRSDAPELYDEITALVKAKKALEAQMTDDEFKQTL